MTSRPHERLLAALLGAALLLFAAQPQIAAAQITPPSSGITGTKHDFSTGEWGGEMHSNEICIFCHTPHNARLTGDFAPLWNRPLSNATYQLYTSVQSTTFDATPAQPSGVSKLCLSCHDGTIAVDSFGMQPEGSRFIMGPANLGTDLRDDHPFSFVYDAALATKDGALRTPVSASLVAPGVPLYAQKLECSTCHSVHSDQYHPFLRVSNARSALCLTCHIK